MTSYDEMSIQDKTTLIALPLLAIGALCCSMIRSKWQGSITVNLHITITVPSSITNIITRRIFSDESNTCSKPNNENSLAIHLGASVKNFVGISTSGAHVRMYKTPYKIVQELENRGVRPEPKKIEKEKAPEAEVEKVKKEALAPKKDSSMEWCIRPRNPLEVKATKIMMNEGGLALISSNCGEQILGGLWVTDHDMVRIYGKFISDKEFSEHPCHIVAIEKYSNLCKEINNVFATVIADIIRSYLNVGVQRHECQHYDWQYSRAPAQPECMYIIPSLHMWVRSMIQNSNGRALN